MGPRGGPRRSLLPPPAPSARTGALVTKPNLYDEFVGRVQRLIRAELLPDRVAVDRKRRSLIVHRRGADVPMDAIRLNRPLPGHPVFRTGAQRPSRVLIERDFGESVGRERGCSRCCRYIPAAQLRVVRPLPAMQQVVVFQMEVQRVAIAAKSNPTASITSAASPLSGVRLISCPRVGRASNRLHRRRRSPALGRYSQARHNHEDL